MASTDGGNVIPLPATTNKTMTRKNQTLPNALEHLNDIRQRLEGRTPALFLDYDGTLAPISQTPDAAIMPAPAIVVRMRIRVPLVGSVSLTRRKDTPADALYYVGRAARALL